MVSFGVCYGIADGVRVQFDADDFSGIAGCDEADGSDSAGERWNLIHFITRSKRMEA